VDAQKAHGNRQEGYNQMKVFIAILTWAARIISLLTLLVFGLLFIEDGLPFFLMTSGDPAMVVHLWALMAMLLALQVGWKWKGLAAILVLGFFVVDEVALFIYGAQFGLQNALIYSFGSLSFPYLLLPLAGLFYLVAHLWQKKTLKGPHYETK
jgi:hypothetical protein